MSDKNTERIVDRVLAEYFKKHSLIHKTTPVQNLPVPNIPVHNDTGMLKRSNDSTEVPERLSSTIRTHYTKNMKKWQTYYSRPLSKLEYILVNLATNVVVDKGDKWVVYCRQFLRFLDITANDTDGRWQILLNYIKGRSAVTFDHATATSYPAPTTLDTLLLEIAINEMSILDHKVAPRLTQSFESVMPPIASQEYSIFGEPDDHDDEYSDHDGDMNNVTDEEVQTEAGEEGEEGEEGNLNITTLSGGYTPLSPSYLFNDVVGVVLQAIELVIQGVDVSGTDWNQKHKTVLSKCNTMLNSGDHNTFCHSYDYRVPGDEGGHLQRPSRNYYYKNDTTADNPASRNDDIAASFRRLCLLAVYLILSTTPNTETFTKEDKRNCDQISKDTIIGIVEKTHRILIEDRQELGSKTKLGQVYESAIEYKASYEDVHQEIQKVTQFADNVETAVVSAPTNTVITKGNPNFSTVARAKLMPSIALLANSLALCSEVALQLLLARGCLGTDTERFEYPSSTNVYEQEETFRG